MRIKLTYPQKSHEIDDLWPLYEEFKEAHPDIFQNWLSIESKGRLDSSDELKDVHMAIREFLMERVDWDSNAALTGAFADFRRIIIQDQFSK